MSLFFFFPCFLLVKKWGGLAGILWFFVMKLPCLNRNIYAQLHLRIQRRRKFLFSFLLSLLSYSSTRFRIADELLLLFLEKLEQLDYGATWKKFGWLNLFRNQMTLEKFLKKRPNFSWYEWAGVTWAEFDWICAGTINEILRKPKTRCVPHIMGPRLRIAAVLHYLKDSPSCSSLQSEFWVHWKTLYRDRDLILPILCAFMAREAPISMLYLGDPSIAESFNGARVLIDCTSH